jgi:hypothetical protein
MGPKPIIYQNAYSVNSRLDPGFRHWSRREFGQRVSLIASAVALGGFSAAASASAETSSLWDPEAMEFLQGIAADTVKAAHVPPGAFKMGGGVNTTGIPLITPGGSYPAFWVRDYAMSLDAGLIGPDEMLPQLKLIAAGQNGPNQRKLPGGAIIPPFAIADHILMSGKPVYVPGGQYQSAYPWGPLPPADDHFYFIHVAWAYWRDTKDAAFLSEPVDGLTILDRLIKAFHATVTDPQTGAVVAESARRMVGFGFQDAILLLGAMGFATLLGGGRPNSWPSCAGRPRNPKKKRRFGKSPKPSRTISSRCSPPRGKSAAGSEPPRNGVGSRMCGPRCLPCT